MATDRYIDANVAAGSLGTALSNSGVEPLVIQGLVEKTADDNNGSVLRLAKGLRSDMVLKTLVVASDALTGATDVDVGLYETDSGSATINAVNRKDIFANGISLASGTTQHSPTNALAAVALEDVNKALYEMVGDSASNKKGSYDLCLTGNTFGTATGTIFFRAEFL